MEQRQNLQNRVGPFLERGLLYAAQTVAGREAGAWPSWISRSGAPNPQPTAAAGPGESDDSRRTITPVAAWRARHQGVSAP